MLDYNANISEALQVSRGQPKDQRFGSALGVRALHQGPEKGAQQHLD